MRYLYSLVFGCCSGRGPEVVRVWNSDSRYELSSMVEARYFVDNSGRMYKKYAVHCRCSEYAELCHILAVGEAILCNPYGIVCEKI